MSLEAFDALPEEKPNLEYWDGVVVQKAVGKRKHWRMQLKIARALAEYVEAHGGECGPEAHIWFEAKQGWLVPDAVCWAPGKPQGDDDRALPPTLAVEIRSPDESRNDQRQKCRNMRANGVDVCWFIDPETRTVERFEGDADADPIPADGPLESAHLPGFSLPLSTLFAVLDR